jgi:hypothetical protein
MKIAVGHVTKMPLCLLRETIGSFVLPDKILTAL